MAVLSARLNAAKGAASTKVREAVKPEYTRLVQAMAKAIEALKMARAEYDSLLDQFSAEDVEWTALTPMQPTFCGDRHDGHLERWLRAAREIGYHGAQRGRLDIMVEKVNAARSKSTTYTRKITLPDGKVSSAVTACASTTLRPLEGVLGKRLLPVRLLPP
ncbi:hypothetical protein [Mesorhizobium sp. M00.F.Ca.ET.216.01.1.1]|uniref:hypothetical protein n=1 Tax=Mesorhizobium sp. M00.F.Ca.ET.216.01.1.1 TaxID=2500528 RepID=UPI001FE0A024|nr:hypothetical protein [Mesorhizobium sp. M00.F.Ca.ET.216.01.1.1]